jgi:WD40 repeat protein
LKCTSHHSCFATGASISSIYFDTSDGRIAAGGNDGRVALFDANTASLLHVFSDHSSAVTAVRITGNMLASVSDGGTLRLSSFDSLVKDTSRGEEGSFLSKTTEVVANTAGTPAPQKRSFFGGSSRSSSSAAAAAAINNSATVDASSSSQSHNETGSSTISSVQIYHPYNSYASYAAVSKITNSKPLISVDAWTKPSEIPSTEGGGGGGGQGQVLGGINKSRGYKTNCYMGNFARRCSCF